MFRNGIFILLAFFVIAHSGFANEPDAVDERRLSEVEEYGLSFIDESKLFAHLNYIASDLFEGREATERGAELTAGYAASLFRMWGLRPVGDDLDISGWQGPSYFQKFDVIEYETLSSSTLTVVTSEGDARYTTNFSYEVDFDIGFGVRENVNITAPVVFVGYGLDVPEEDYNELRNVNVEDRIVLLLQGVPRDDDDSLVWNESGQRGRYAGLRTKLSRLREKGAAGILVVQSRRDGRDLYRRFAQNTDHTHPRFNRYYEGDEPMEPRRRMYLAQSELSGPPVFNVTRKVADNILTTTGKTLEELQNAMDENLRPQSRELPNVTATMRPEFATQVLQTRNVVGMIEGRDPALKDEVIIVGAHYDHDGRRSGFTWNGADDNGSGTSGVLTLAHAFTTAPERPKRSILFALWGAEEKGLLGSYYFAGNPVIPIENIVTKKNLDMIGRDQHNPNAGILAEDNTNQVYVNVSEQLPLLEEIVKQNNEYTGLDITLRVRNITGGGSDYVPFARKGIPVLNLFTGFHKDYHQPSDTVEKINFDKMTRIVRLAYLNLWSLADYEGVIEPEM